MQVFHYALQIDTNVYIIIMFRIYRPIQMFALGLYDGILSISIV